MRQRRGILGRPKMLAGAAAGILALGSSARALVSSNAGPNVFDGVNINQLVGADRFYWNGYWGSRAVIANVEAGHIWNGHETLSRLDTYFNDPSIDTGTRQYDWHATMVGHCLGGQGILYGWTINDFNTAAWYGMAPEAQIWSGAIASKWNADPNPQYEFTGSFEITSQSFIYGYKTPMQTGINGRKADVINSSWGFEEPTGSADETKIIDALAYANHTTVVLAAGNHDGGTAQVYGPASGYNSIVVAALAPDTGSQPYMTPATFSNAGPNDYLNPKAKLNQVTPGVRATVSIAAPGDNLTLAFYSGVTGGHTSGTDFLDGSGQYYYPDMGGTSFASPIVAGGAGLLVDLGYDRFGGGTSIDGRVIKAVLLNAADKTLGWNNGQHVVNGVITTSQSLDYNVGAGRLNLDRAYDQYTAGTTDLPGLRGGIVPKMGWDFGEVSVGAPTDYYISERLVTGYKLTATLDWFVNRQFDETTQSAADVQFDDLDLQVWSVVDSLPSSLIAESASAYNNVEHLWFDLPADGFYMLRVSWYGENYDMPGSTPNADQFGLAWAVTVPEPGGMVVIAIAGALLVRRRRLRS